MPRLSSTVTLASAFCICLGLIASGALAQEADLSVSEPTESTTEQTDLSVSEQTEAITEPTDLTVPTEWQPGDGRPQWSKSQNPSAAPNSTWQPGNGQPYWANGSDKLSKNNRQTGQSYQPAPRGVAKGIGNRGKGRNK